MTFRRSGRLCHFASGALTVAAFVNVMVDAPAPVLVINVIGAVTFLFDPVPEDKADG